MTCKASAPLSRWRFRSSQGRNLLICLAVMSLPGCASSGPSFFQHAEQNLVWPEPPEAPRIRYLGSISGTMRPRPEDGLGAAVNRVFFGETEFPSLVTPHAIAMHADGDRLAVADPNAKCVHLLQLASKRYARIEWLDVADPAKPAGDGVPDEPVAEKEGAEPGAPPTDNRWGTALEAPVGVAWARNLLLIADATRHAVFVVDPAAKERSRPWPAHRVIGEDLLRRPAGLAFDDQRGVIVVSDAAAHCVRLFDMDGRLVRSFGERGAGPGQFNFPAQVAVDRNGAILVVDAMNFRVQRFTVDGAFLGAFGRKGDAAGDFSLPKGVAIDTDGRVWVVDAHFENVQAFNPDGRLLLAFGGEGHGPGQFWLPAGVAIDGQRRLWVADAYNRRVQAFELLR